MRWFTSTCLAAFASLWIINSTATAGGNVDLDAICPATANAGQAVTVTFTLKNKECTDQDVRLLSSVVGNADQTLGGLGLYGPVVADSTTLPAATDLLPGTCTGSTCDGSTNFSYCMADADCVCREVVPSTTSIPLATPPTLPSSLTGTVATLVFLAGPAGEETAEAHCLVEVLAP